jgi:hypothetical protein
MCDSPVVHRTAHRLRHSALIPNASNAPNVITVVPSAPTPPFAPRRSWQQPRIPDLGDAWATPELNSGSGRLLVVGVRGACSGSSGVAMKRLLVAVGVVAIGLLAWTPRSDAAPSLWQGKQPSFTNVVASQPTTGAVIRCPRDRECRRLVRARKDRTTRTIPSRGSQ